MQLTDEIKHFIASPVMIIVGSRDAANRPSIGRAVGARAPREDCAEVVLSAWQWPETAANLIANGQAAITFARPSDYVSYQIKGNVTLRAAGPEDLELSAFYRAAVLEMFSKLGLAAELVRPWLVDRDPVVASLKVRELYIQTPGPKAGTAIRAETR